MSLQSITSVQVSLHFEPPSLGIGCDLGQVCPKNVRHESFFEVLKGSSPYHNLDLPYTSSSGHLSCMVLHALDSKDHLLWHSGCTYHPELDGGLCSMILPYKELGGTGGR